MQVNSYSRFSQAQNQNNQPTFKARINNEDEAAFCHMLEEVSQHGRFSENPREKQTWLSTFRSLIGKFLPEDMTVTLANDDMIKTLTNRDAREIRVFLLNNYYGEPVIGSLFKITEKAPDKGGLRTAEDTAADLTRNYQECLKGQSTRNRYEQNE